MPTKIRARSSRIGSVRSRAMTATRTSSVATRPNGSGPGRHIHDALGLAEPEREHLLEVGEQLARSPRRLGRVIEPLGKRPGGSSLEGRPKTGEPLGRRRPAGCRSRSCVAAAVVGRHRRQFRTRGVAWAARSCGRAPRRSVPSRRQLGDRDDGDDLEGRGQPGRRPDRHGRLRQGGRFPAARRHRSRRVLGRQCSPGVRLLPRALGLHAGRVQRARDEGPRPGQLRHGPERHPVRVHSAADPGRRDRRARPRAR